MATLSEIEILGIRSFGPDDGDAQRIKFFKPLTLIVGENGCGKSTIIESLRYISTHKEPSGKSTFIHDPSLTNKALVKASIKLSMYDIRNEKVNLSKSLQLTKNKTTLTQKFLDACITTRDRVTGKKKSLSGKCADYTIAIPKFFGVSTAILENVIFCTQEDSHWPLETDKKLKEKFDEIFDSERYNKCVNKVRDKKKKIKQDFQTVSIELGYLKENKDKAAEKRRQLQIAKNQENRYKEQIEKCDTDIKPIEEKYKDVLEAEQKLGKLTASKESKKNDLKNVENHRMDLKKRIRDEFVGSDEALELEIANFAKGLKNRQESLHEKQGEIEDMEIEENKLSKERIFKEKQLGQLQTEEEHYKREVEERLRRLNKLAAELEIDVSGQSQSSDEHFLALFNQAKNKIEEKDEEFSNFQQKCEKENQELQNEIYKLQKKCMSVQNEVDNKQKAISNSQKEMKEIERKLREVEQSASKLSRIENQLSKASKELEELQSTTNVESLKEEIKTHTQERNRLEERLSEIQDEIDVLQKQAAISAELDIQLAAKNTKDADIRRLLNKHDDTLIKLLGSIPQSGFKTSIQSHIDQLRRKVRELNMTNDKLTKELAKLETNRTHLKEQLSNKEDVLRRDLEEIDNECEGDDFEDVLNRTETELNNVLDNKGILSSSKHIYNNYLKQFEKPKPCCPVCHRDFERQNDVDTLIAELTEKLEHLPSKITENQSDLEKVQSKYNKLLTLKPKYSNISELKNQEIPELRSKLETTENNLKKTRKELEEIKKQIAEPQKDETTCTAIQGDMALLDQLQSEQKRLEREIEKLEAKLGGNKGSKGNLEQVQKEQEEIRRKLKTARDKIEQLQTKLNQQMEKLQRLQATINSLMDERNKIQGGESQKKQLEERYEALQAAEAVESVELNDLKEQLTSEKKLLQDAESNKKTVKMTNDDKINKMRSSVNNLHRQRDEIETVQRRVRTLAEKGISKKLEEVHEAINKLKNQIEDIKRKRESVFKEIDDIKKVLADQQARERDLEDNLKYRQKTEEASRLRKELEELEDKFGSLDARDIMKKKNGLREEIEKIKEQKQRLRGQLVELQNTIESLGKELNSRTYKTADAKYSEAFVKAELLKAIETDLDRYSNAMEWALMKYHTIQMEKVNSFIREYWRKIYQGNDIDYIEIKTDEVTGTEKKRNYNYRLVQVKSDVPLDMRNRCSAGQKMLASLIIRMALAETFSGNCGILTLDEPTTNLDRKNIRNLARTLNEVLVAKQEQGNNNFQLIVITHDEEFVRELMEVDAISEYIKIERTPSGKSRAVVESVEDVARTSNHPDRNQEGRDEFDYD